MGKCVLPHSLGSVVLSVSVTTRQNGFRAFWLRFEDVREQQRERIPLEELATIPWRPGPVARLIRGGHET
jgi:hypothetical protein